MNGWMDGWDGKEHISIPRSHNGIMRECLISTRLALLPRSLDCMYVCMYVCHDGLSVLVGEYVNSLQALSRDSLFRVSDNDCRDSLAPRMLFI